MIKRFQRMRGDEGFALVLAIGFGLTVAMLTTLALAIASRSQTSGRNHVSFEQAVVVAESGIDQTLARVAKAFSAGGGDYSTPAPGDASCNLTSVSAPATGFADEAAERTWARSQLEGLVTANGGACVAAGGAGQFVVLKPTNRQVVYSLAAVPAFSSTTAKKRLLKTEYLFSPYRPGKAILTGDKLDFGGSVAVDATLQKPGGVHSNGSLSAPSSVNVDGPISASGTATGGSVTAGFDANGESGSNKPKIGLPVIDPRQVWRQQKALFYDSWFDLCPDGTVRKPSGAAPCEAGSLAADTTQGWSFDSASKTWSQGSSAYDGVYYALGGNIDVNTGEGKSGDVWRTTLIAESVMGTPGSNAATCDKIGGDISVRKSRIENVIPGVVLLAQADLYTHTQTQVGDGLMAAGDQLDLKTSSGGDAAFRGAFLSTDSCPSAAGNQIQGIELTYLDSADGFLSTVIRTTLWLEYVGV